MSVDISQINYPIKDKLKTEISVPAKHSLILLAESIPWSDYAELAIKDLYEGKKRSGRKLNLRLHLGAFLLQTLSRWTDRELEENLSYYAPARVFCGLEGKAYDHSAYVRFRNRLSEETVQQFNVLFLKKSYRKGFTGTDFIDLDSTVQEANIEYPSDMRMMQAIVRKGVKVLTGLVDAGSTKAKNILARFDMKKINKDFKSYFFAKKNADGFELKLDLFSKAHTLCKKMMTSIKEIDSILTNYNLPWNYKKELDQLTDVAPLLLKQINHFIKNKEVAPRKILSLHAKEVKCIAKGKAGKPYEFGRKFFISRLPGNYALVFTAKDFALEDAFSMEQALDDYGKVFEMAPHSVSADQAFWSRPNLKACEQKNIMEVGITPRGHKNWKVPKDKAEELLSRRAKVEPIIGHLKRRGMGRSKMKSDEMTKIDGLRSALSLNMSRMAKDLSDGVLKWSG